MELLALEGGSILLSLLLIFLLLQTFNGKFSFSNTCVSELSAMSVYKTPESLK